MFSPVLPLSWCEIDVNGFSLLLHCLSISPGDPAVHFCRGFSGPVALRHTVARALPLSEELLKAGGLQRVFIDTFTLFNCIWFLSDTPFSV
jgi:hypothetical protein